MCHCACWGETPHLALQAELKKGRFGYNAIGSDGTRHNYARLCYESRLTIPDVVPDEKYVPGWACCGGWFCKLRTNAPQMPCEGNSYFCSDFMSCAFVRVVFVGSQFATPNRSACMAAFDSLRKSKADARCRFMRPRSLRAPHRGH